MGKTQRIAWFAIGALLAFSILLFPLGSSLHQDRARQEPLLAPFVTEMLTAGAVQSTPGTWVCSVRSNSGSCPSNGCTVTVSVSCVPPEKAIYVTQNVETANGLALYRKPLNWTTWTFSVTNDGTSTPTEIDMYVLCCK